MVAYEGVRKYDEHSFGPHIFHLSAKEFREVMSRRMIASMDGGILLLGCPGLVVDEYWHSLLGILCEERDSLVAKM